MKKINYWLISTVALAVAVVVLLCNLKSCAPNQHAKPSATVKKVIVYKTDTVFSFLQGKVHFSERVVHDTVLFQKIIHSGGDTLLSFIQGCTDIIYTADTFAKPHSYLAILNDTVQNNRISGRSFRFADLRPDTLTYITIKEPAKQALIKIYMGAGLSAAFKNKIFSSYQGNVDIDAIFRDKVLFGISAGMNSNIEPVIGVRVAGKISLKK